MISATQLTESTDLTDEHIVEEVLAGRTPLFELLMRRHNERLYRAARAIVLDEREAEDVVQQAYVNAYAHLRQFDGRARFSTWLTRITVNEAIARARRRGRYVDLEGGESGRVQEIMARHSPPDPERQAFSRELFDLMESAIDGLADGCREVFVLRQVQGLSTAETAQCLSVSEDVVKTRLSRARASLRQNLFDRAGLAAPDAFHFQGSRCDRLVTRVLASIG